MALPNSSVLEQLPDGLGRLVRLGGEARSREPGLKLGWGELDALLPDGGLPRGAVTELAVVGGAALGTSFGLRACRAAQGRKGQAPQSLAPQSVGSSTEVPLCAFVDPSATLYGPGVVRLGVVLDRLLVVRPRLEDAGAVALRLVQSKLFAVTVIDTLGIPGSGLGPSNLLSWARGVRQLSMALEGTLGVALLITDAAARRPLPLPVALRLELRRPAENKLSVRVAKDKLGRLSSARTVRWPPTEEEASTQGFEPLSQRSHARLFA